MTASLAVVDGVVAAWLFWSVPRQQRNKGVIVVGAVLLAMAGWLGVLAAT